MKTLQPIKKKLYKMPTDDEYRIMRLEKKVSQLQFIVNDLQQKLKNKYY